MKTEHENVNRLEIFTRWTNRYSSILFVKYCLPMDFFFFLCNRKFNIASTADDRSLTTKLVFDRWIVIEPRTSFVYIKNIVFKENINITRNRSRISKIILSYRTRSGWNNKPSNDAFYLFFYFRPSEKIFTRILKYDRTFLPM